MGTFVLDFGAGFDVTESPADEFNVTLDASEVNAAPTGAIDIGDAAVAGTAATFTSSDHQHAFPAPAAAYPLDVAAAKADGIATTPARADHVHAHGSGYLADAHHAQAHTVEGAAHTTAGGTDGYVHRQTGATTHAWEADVGMIEFIIDGGGLAITTGVKGDLEVPYDCTVTGWTIVANQSGSIVVDVWKDTYALFPPTVADTIAGTEKPTLASVQKNQDLTLTTWTTTLTRGDWLRFNVDSITTVQRVTVSMRVTKT